MKTVRRVRRAWPVALWVLAVLVLLGVGLWYPTRGPDCRTVEAGIARRVHTESEPVARELAPLGAVREVHWVERVVGGMCELSPGALTLDREGVVRLQPRDGDALAGRVRGVAPSELETDNRLTPWLPTAPRWRTVPDLEGRLDLGNGYETVWYDVDTASATVYFRSSVDYEPDG
nr:hypothetical protein [Micromonospora sp. DSM 115978]